MGGRREGRTDGRTWVNLKTQPRNLVDSKDVVWRYQALNNNCRVMKRYVTNLAFELIIPLGGVESDILMCTKVYH